ncbi:hypothetical protein B0H63DRAFT_268128 [Podospora didyma]|uniref:Protein FAF1 n=1 Tax=Podospora didyma TaxID=330526 RepID=A0AAE0KEN9_9PEZI|nr:hypothetical protein B0H63DRAFT_268128 [Podospora didyma]
MPSMLGKRKSRSSGAAAVKGDDTAVDISDAQATLQRFFEASFRPISVAARASKTAAARQGQEDDEMDEDDDDDDDDDSTDSDQSESEWDGVSEEGNDNEDHDGGPAVEVVDHTSSEPIAISTMTKKELKAYLSSRPPSHPTDAAQVDSKKTKAEQGQPEDSAAFLANDLALQRLISESHILSAAGGNASHYMSSSAAETATNTKTFAAGRTRRITTELRVQALGAKQSLLTQSKMPMSMRKGISTAVTSREVKRRREAKENGIILERESKKPAKPAKKKRSERPVDMPGVGRMRGAELRISAREAQAIASSGEKKGRDKKSRGRRK